MKPTTVLLVLLLAIGSFSLNAQRGVRLGYVDMDYILKSVEEYQTANQQLAKRVQKWKVEVEEQRATIAQMRSDLTAEKVLLTKELIQEREDEINALELQMKDYQQDRFGPQGDLVRQRSQLVKPIQDQVFNAVQEIAANKKFDFVFDKSADVVMLYADKRYDISDQVLRSINATRKKGGVSEDSALDKYQEEEPNPELLKREQAYEQKKEDRAADIEQRRAEKLQEIEARKKAYEERRKKMLEEREAKRQEKLEERARLIEENNNTNSKENDQSVDD